jgi:hypothetical protein
MHIGIVGLPNVGKSTLFQAITKKQVDTSNYPFATIDPNVGVVAVPDTRLDQLAHFSESKKVVPAIIEFVDIAGLVKGASLGEGLGNQFLANIREVDAICHVVRAFENSTVIHIGDAILPQSDFEIIRAELVLKDLDTIIKVKDRAMRETRTGKKEAFEYLQAVEEIERALETNHSENLSPAARACANELQLLSAKPYFIVFNISQQKNITTFDSPHSISVDIAQERDMSMMTAKEQKDLGLESELPTLIRHAYDLLGLMTFFTTGEDESRAWTIPKNSTAKRAGRAIHSDFEEKFIRADVIFWQKLLEAGSWSKARDLGLIRSEGKEYIVQDGDVIEFKI